MHAAAAAPQSKGPRVDLWEEAQLDAVTAASAADTSAAEDDDRPLLIDSSEDEDANANERWCPDCWMWINGLNQWEDHLIGRKHRKILNKCVSKKKKKGDAQRRVEPKKGITIPENTCFLLQQAALISDATQLYMLSLYRKSAFRARL